MNYTHPPNHYGCLGNNERILLNQILLNSKNPADDDDIDFNHLQLITNEKNVDVESLLDTDKITKVFVLKKYSIKYVPNYIDGLVLQLLLLFERDDGIFVIIDMHPFAAYKNNNLEYNLNDGYHCVLYYSRVWIDLLNTYKNHRNIQEKDENLISMFEYMYSVPIKLPLINWINPQNIKYNAYIIPSLINLRCGLPFKCLQDIFQMFIDFETAKFDLHNKLNIQLYMNSSNVKKMCCEELLNSQNFLKIFLSGCLI